MKLKCNGSGQTAEVKTVYSYESVDGKQHRFVNCPVCGHQFKAKGECFVPPHKHQES